MTATNEQIRQAVWDSIRQTINKFRENPFYFFTESDIHSYLYHCLYSGNLEVERENRRIYLVHREYPTNFRYNKEALLLPDYIEPYPLSSRQGDRGNFDLAVINPEFVTTAPRIEDVVNKDVVLVQDRIETNLEAVRRELLFAVEFKFVTRNTISFVTEVLQDNKKLSFAKQWGAVEVVNLVFCNIQDTASYVSQIQKAVTEAPKDLHAFFVHAFYKNGQKQSPKLISNVVDERYEWIAPAAR